MSEHAAAAPGGSRRRRPPRFYFSLRSPYSWLAYRDLHERHPDVADVLEWRPSGSTTPSSTWR
ncbi:hypothetical protein ACFWUZ_13460 [Streptomyces sp. NPDC058646]|uniref:hypothetical protein n=1 Tax=Streptomyces sp. NPDC058646 TaxID=3346574 RepID=UPI0036607483